MVNETRGHGTSSSKVFGRTLEWKPCPLFLSKVRFNRMNQKTFYRTEDSWTVPAQFAAFQELVSSLEKRYGLSLDPEGFYRNPDNYKFTLYPDFFLGYMGLFTSALLSGRDDFVKITPRFDKDYSVEFLGGKDGFTQRKGGGAETLFYEEILEIYAESGIKAEQLPDDYYLKGRYSMATIRNLDKPNLPKALLVHDGTDGALACLLAPMTSELVVINLREGRYLPRLGGYAKSKKFDLAVVISSPAAIEFLKKI